MSTQDFTPKTTFDIGVFAAVETGQRSEAPSGVNAFWWQGGGWFNIVTDGMPGLMDQQVQIFPVGHSGKRTMHQQPPVPGRRWSSGDLNAIATAEFIGPWFYAALGSASHNTVPSTVPVLLAASAIESDGQQFALTSQPSDGGAILQIPLSGTTGSGYLRVAGTDAEGNAASEFLSFDDETAVLYTRTSFSAVTGIDVDSVQTLGGSLAVNGIKHFIHTLSPGSENPTFSIERIGDPSAGAASKSFVHTGMVIQTLGIDSPAEARDGTIAITSTWEGDPTATCTGKAIQEASGVRLWPSWVLSLTRDGSVYLNPTNHSISIDSGGRNYRSAAGVQNPQGTFYGGREATQSMDLLLANESEFLRWRGASKQNLVLSWVTPWSLQTGQAVQMTASLTDTYIETVSGGESDDAYIYSAEMRSIANAATDFMTVQLLDNIPPNAYGASTVIN